METASYCDHACLMEVNQDAFFHAKIPDFIDYSKSFQEKAHYCQMLHFSLLNSFTRYNHLSRSGAFQKRYE